MMNSAVEHFALNAGSAYEVWEFSEETVDRSAPSDGFHARDL
jgi:hypothetical protein